MQSGLIDGAPYLAADLAGLAVGIFVADQEIGQHAVPEISVKAVDGGKVQDVMHETVKIFCRLLQGGGILPPVLFKGFDQAGGLFQDLSAGGVSVNDEFTVFHTNHPIKTFVSLRINDSPLYFQ